MNCEILTTRKGMHFQAWQFNSRVWFWNGIVQTQWLVPENIVDSTGKYFDMKWHDGRVSSDPVCETNFQIAWAWPPLKKNDVDWSDQETTTSTLILRMMGTNGQKAKKLPCFALLLTTCFLTGEFLHFFYLFLLSPSGDLGIGLVWDNPTPPRTGPTFWSDCWNPLQSELNYLWGVLICSQDDIRWF